MKKFKRYISIFLLALMPSFYLAQIDSLLMDFDTKEHLGFREQHEMLYKLLQGNTYGKDGFDYKTDIYRRLGILFQQNGERDMAIYFYKKAIGCAEKSKHKYARYSQASNMSQLGAAYYELKNYKQAYNYFKQSFQLNAANPPHYLDMSQECCNMAEILLLENKLDSAQILCLQSLDYMRKWRNGSDTSRIGFNYYLLSQIALKKHELKNALRYCETAVDLLKKENYLERLISALTQKALVFEAMQQPDSALSYYQAAYATAKFKNYKKHIAQTAQDLALFYGNKNEKDSAIKYLHLLNTYSDTLKNETLMRVSYEMLTKYDTETKETALNHQTKLNQQMKIQIIILTGLVFMLIIAVFFILRSIRQQRKIREKDMELNQANAMIRGQDEERERIARELHDRVGSMLSTVKLHFSSMEEHLSGLLSQQRTAYEKTIHLLDETYEEVRRISHDLDTGLLGQFGLRTAMMQLTQLIQSANKLRVQYLDNDLRPELYKKHETDLYRITQELLSNTIKYADAKEVSIQLSKSNGNLVFSYEDDGRGFSKDILKQSKGIGYTNIDSRVKKMKGTWHLDTSAGNGVSLIIEIPLSEN
ncbi:MAG: hypothetical protein KF900_13150 [Bacteroidetes bacterium]|nr:hypothetical protein [Bacteroidota bacterium]